MATPQEIEAARAQLESLQEQIRQRDASVLTDKETISRGTIGGTVDSLAQGLTFGFADEIEAGIKAPFADDPFEGATFKDRFNSILFDLGRKREAFSKTNPVLSGTAELAGGIGQGVGLLRAGSRFLPGATKAITSLPAVPRLAGVGAAEGALFGAGSSNPGERLSGAATGAALGGILSPFVAGAASAGASVVRPAVQKLIDSVTKTPKSKAVGLIVNAMKRDDITPDEASALINRFGRGQATLSDIGENLTDLTRTATTIPSRGKQSARLFLDSRQEDSRIRLVQAARNASRRSEFDNELVNVINRAESKAAPLYQEAYSNVLDVTPRMAEILKRPAMEKAVLKAGRKVRNLGFSSDIVNDVTDVRFMDTVKRALDDDIGIATRQGRRDDARILVGLKNEFLNEIDSQVPAYARAREIFSGEAAIRDAVDIGRNALKPGTSSDDLSRSLAGMTESELNGARHGLLTSLTDQIDNLQSVTGAANRFTGVPKIRSAIQQIFPNTEALERFLNQAVAEGRFAQTRNTILGGSPTARIQASQRAAASESGPVDLFFDAATGGSSGLLRSVKNAIFKTDIEPEVAEELVKILLDPKVIPNNIRQPLVQRAGNFLIPKLNRQDFTGAVTGSVGAGVTGPLPSPVQSVTDLLINAGIANQNP